jgi:hypothetical protein
MCKQIERQHYSLEDIVKLYPLYYSQKRMDEWQGLFDERAIMVKVEKEKPVSCLSIIEGMPEQREYAAENKTFIEEWQNVEITQYGNIAVIKADYILTTDHEIRKGADVLTLCSDCDGWLITNLTYEQKEFIIR